MKNEDKNENGKNPPKDAEIQENPLKPKPKEAIKGE
jgi:hypothetical protein